MSSFLFSLLPLPDVEQGIRDLEDILLIGAGRVSYPGGGDVTYASPEHIKSHLRALYERRAALVRGRRRPGMSFVLPVYRSGY